MIKILNFLIFSINSISAIGNSKDSSSYSNIDEAITEHIDLDWDVEQMYTEESDFVFYGTVKLTMKTIADNVTSVFLDSAEIQINKVDYQHVHEGCSIWTNVEFNVTTPNPNIGDAVEVHLPSAQPANSSFMVRI